MGVASLVLGIISILISVFTVGIYGYIGVILGIVGIILGSMGKKDPEKKGIATAGFVCSIIGTILGLLLYIACVACASAIVSAL